MLGRQSGAETRVGNPGRSVSLAALGREEQPIPTRGQRKPMGTSTQTLATQASRIRAGLGTRSQKPMKGQARTSKTALSKAEKQAIVSRGGLGSKMQPVVAQAMKARLRSKFPQANKATTPTPAQQPTTPTARMASSRTGPAATNIQRALQGGGTTITQVALRKLSPFLQTGLKTRPVKPVI